MKREWLKIQSFHNNSAHSIFLPPRKNCGPHICNSIDSICARTISWSAAEPSLRILHDRNIIIIRTICAYIGANERQITLYLAIECKKLIEIRGGISQNFA